MVCMKFAKAIRAARMSAGLSREQLGRKIGRGRSTIHEWETGRYSPNPVALRKLSRVLNIPIADLARWKLS